MKQARRRTLVEPERITPREFIAAWQSSFSIAEVSKKTGIRKKAVRVRAYRYRQAGIPLKEFPPVELPNWDELADFAASLVPKKPVPTSAGKSGQGAEHRADPPAAVEGVEAKPAIVEEKEDSPAPVGESEAEPAARHDVQVGDAASEREAQDQSR